MYTLKNSKKSIGRAWNVAFGRYISKRSDVQTLWAVNNFVIVRMVDVRTAFN